MARLHVQTHTAGQCDSHCRVIDSHDLHHADGTNHAGYQQLTIKNIKHLKEKREMMIKLVNPDCDAGSNTLLKIALDRLVDRGTIMSYNLRNGDATIICDL